MNYFKGISTVTINVDSFTLRCKMRVEAQNWACCADVATGRDAALLTSKG